VRFVRPVLLLLRLGIGREREEVEELARRITSMRQVILDVRPALHFEPPLHPRCLSSPPEQTRFAL
jgi:hypothetical protein